MDVVYIDFSNAFDNVPLIQKIEMHGINSELVIWIQNCRTDRRHRVVVKIQAGGLLPVGSMLGPLLFMIYTNHWDKNVDRLVNKIT